MWVGLDRRGRKAEQPPPTATFTGAIALQYAWLIWSLVLLVVWGILFVLARQPASRREMLTVSVVTSLFGLSEPLFVPRYWSPPSLFDLAQKTGFDIESLVFSFAIGGIAVVIYEAAFPSRHVPMPPAVRLRHRLHPVAIASAPVVFLLLELLTDLNPIYSAVVAFAAGGLSTVYCRPDLTIKMLVSSIIFLGLYFFYFLSLVLMFPRYVDLVWNLSDLSGVLVAGIPVEELMFAATFGFMWSSAYEHLRWLRLQRVGNAATHARSES